jgi:hypothetical protein
VSSCSACDHARLILCLDCYRRADDDHLPKPYPEYLRRAAGYPVGAARRAKGGILLGAVLAVGVVFAAVTATDARHDVRRHVADLQAKTDVVNGKFLQLRDAQECADDALKADFVEELERAARGEQSTVCRPFARP